MATRYFDYESVARESGISDSDLEIIKNAVRADYPSDDMTWELHVLRGCTAVRDGHVTVEEIASRRAA